MIFFNSWHISCSIPIGIMSDIILGREQEFIYDNY